MELTTEQLKKIRWPQRFALIEKYSPKDQLICAVFNVSQSDLNTARTLLGNGTIVADHAFPVDDYVTLFIERDVNHTDQYISRSSTKGTGTQITRTNTATVSSKNRSVRIDYSPPESARPPDREKPGRKSSKINDAYVNVPLHPVPFLEYCAQRNVSKNTLIQRPRFLSDTALNRQLSAAIRIYTDKTTKVKMIVRAAVPGIPDPTELTDDRLAAVD